MSVATGVENGSKLSVNVTETERGKPVYSPMEFQRQVKPQGTLLDMREEETGESESLAVMAGIRVATSPGPKGSRLPEGV